MQNYSDKHSVQHNNMDGAFNLLSTNKTPIAKFLKILIILKDKYNSEKHACD